MAPPPPPPPPPPPAAPPPIIDLKKKSGTPSPSSNNDRSALLQQIQKGTKLRCTETNDRSAPQVGKVAGGSSSVGKAPAALNGPLQPSASSVTSAPHSTSSGGTQNFAEQIRNIHLKKSHGEASPTRQNASRGPHKHETENGEQNGEISSTCSKVKKTKALPPTPGQPGIIDGQKPRPSVPNAINRPTGINVASRPNVRSQGQAPPPPPRLDLQTVNGENRDISNETSSVNIKQLQERFSGGGKNLPGQPQQNAQNYRKGSSLNYVGPKPYIPTQKPFPSNGGVTSASGATARGPVPGRPKSRPSQKPEFRTLRDQHKWKNEEQPNRSTLTKSVSNEDLSPRKPGPPIPPRGPEKTWTQRPAPLPPNRPTGPPPPPPQQAKPGNTSVNVTLRKHPPDPDTGPSYGMTPGAPPPPPHSSHERPPPLPARKSSRVSLLVNFEERFQFCDPSQLPPPPMFSRSKKIYPQMHRRTAPSVPL